MDREIAQESSRPRTSPPESYPVAYVGATGVTTVAAAEAINELVPAVLGLRRRLMIGVLVSGHRTLQGEAPGSARYPDIETAHHILRKLTAEVFGTVHFNTRSPKPLGDQLCAVMGRCPYARGIQLNLESPDPDELRRFRRLFPDVEIIVQASPPPTEQRPIDWVGTFARTYAGVADHVLLDRSRGAGHALITSWAADVISRYGSEWKARGMSYGVAGGFGPEAQGEVEALAALLPDTIGGCSFDAESGVCGADGGCEPEKVAAWVAALGRGLKAAKERRS